MTVVNRISVHSASLLLEDKDHHRICRKKKVEAFYWYKMFNCILTSVIHFENCFPAMKVVYESA